MTAAQQSLERQVLDETLDKAEVGGDGNRASCALRNLCFDRYRFLHQRCPGANPFSRP